MATKLLKEEETKERSKRKKEKKKEKKAKDTPDLGKTKANKNVGSGGKVEISASNKNANNVSTSKGEGGKKTKDTSGKVSKSEKRDVESSPSATTKRAREENGATGKKKPKQNGKSEIQSTPTSPNKPKQGPDASPKQEKASSKEPKGDKGKERRKETKKSMARTENTKSAVAGGKKEEKHVKKKKNDYKKSRQDKTQTAERKPWLDENGKLKPSTGEVWSKSKKKKMRALRAKQRKRAEEDHNDSVQKQKQTDKEEKEAASASGGPQLSALQISFQKRLSGSRFRILNEELYTQPSWKAFEKFSENPELFDEYHVGYRKQVEQWPSNPIHEIVNRIMASKSKDVKKLSVADFGCGDAELAKRLMEHEGYKVHSFDLVSRSELVTACDMAKVPVSDKCMDVVVFCLSLMGTNLADFVREAHRVLRKKGHMYVAEVRSRFESKDAKDDELFKDFLNVLEKLGFKCVNTDRKNKMFVLLEFHKNGKKPDPKLDYTAKACLYKRR